VGITESQIHYKMQISKKNEVYLQIENLSSSESAELSDFFTFEVPGFKFMPAYRNRVWDGKIRLFSPASGEIYVGLLPYVRQWCSDNGVQYEISKEVEGKRTLARSVVQGFIRSLKPKSRGKSLKVRDYQIDAVHHALSRDRCLLVSPTASGKSLIIYSIVRYYQMSDLTTLILVPTTSLVEQMYKDFEDYGWSSGTYCQKIYQGHDKKVTKSVVISTWQSLYKMNKKYFESFDVVIGDEAHQFKAKSLTSILTKLHMCKYRYGLTGTLDGTQTHKLVLEGLFGPVKEVVSTKELIDKKTLAQLKIKCIILKHKQIRERMTYAEELQHLAGEPKRNKFISDLLLHLNGNTLCLFQLVEKHGKILYEGLKEEENVFLIYGKTDTKEREDIRHIVDGAKNSTIIASYGVFSTGINIRNINHIVLASPSKSKIRVLQSIGRGLRTSSTKDSVLIFDLADDISYRERRNFTLNHFMERINIYNEQQFNYEISKVNLYKSSI
jgi:superfamily II DNA or RNA helicase